MVIYVTVTKVAVLVGIIFTMLLIVPACASAATGGVISGNISFPAVSTYPENLSMPNLTVKDLTIYAVNVDSGFANVTNPNADGSYQIPVPDDGMYQIYVKPDAVADTTRGQDLAVILQYPNREATRLYLVNVYDGNTVKADITGYTPGNYQAPNDLKLPSDTPAETNVTTPTATPTASTPGFLTLLTLAGMIIAVAALIQRRN